MKINSLLQEGITAASSPENATNSAPKMGRSDKFLEDQVEESTTSGCVASVSAPVGKMQRRGKGSMFQGIKTSSKFPNSKVVKEGAYEDGVRDGIQGQANPRASSIYGPESSEYSRGYEDGLVKGKEQSQANVSAYQASLAPYKEIPTDELKQMLRDIRKRTDARQSIYDKYRGSSRFGDSLPPNSEELKKEHKKDHAAWQAIHQELFQRGVPNDQRLEEADEWEEEGDKFQRFLAYAQKQLKDADPAQRISLARRLSMWQVKHFGPENNQSYNPNTGAAIQGNSDITPSIRAILEIINRPSGQTFSSTVSSIPSPQQVEIDNSWRLTDEGKQWLAYAKEELQKAGVNSSDFMEVARALSQQQVKKFGRASMDTRNNITAEISMIIDKIRWLGVVASQQANQEMFNADMTVNELIDRYNDASPQEQATFRANVERDYDMSVQEFFDYLQEHGQPPQTRRQPEDALAEVKKANTKTARKELSKKPKAELSGKDKEAKQSEEDRLWAMLQQHMADKQKEVKEGEEMGTFAALKDWQVWNVHVYNNFYRGKYADYGPRLYSVVASSPEEARQVVINNPDYVLQDLLSRKLQSGKRVLPRGSALPIEAKRVGKAEPGTITTMAFKKMLTPDGVQSFKFTNGKIVDGAHTPGGIEVDEGVGADIAKLGGIASLGIAGGLAGNYADQQQPKVEIGGKIAFVEPAHSRVPDTAMTLTGKDGKTYRVWATRGTAQSQQRYHAVPVQDVKEGNKFFKPGPATTGKFPEPRKPSFQGDQGSKSETLGRDGLIYHWQDPRAKQGVAEAQLDEKSVSQAQFRTMAAVAHNPEFAKKVGISQKVGKEFHSADRKQDYKDLPKEVEEGFDDVVKGVKRYVKGKPSKSERETHHANKTIGAAQAFHQTSDPTEKDYIKQQMLKNANRYYKVKNLPKKVDEAEFTEDKLAQNLYKDLQIFKKGVDKDIGSRAKDKEISNKAKDKDIVAKEDCWDGYEQIGMKDKGGKKVPNCVPVKEEDVSEDWQKTNKQDKTDGMSPKAVKAYRRENPGSKLQTAVTKKPSELKAGSKDAKRRKSFCARMSGNKGPMKDENGKPTPKAKALKRWNC